MENTTFAHISLSGTWSYGFVICYYSKLEDENTDKGRQLLFLSQILENVQEFTSRTKQVRIF